jgi:hypothetical protein
MERGWELGEFLACANQHGFRFVVVEFQFVGSHPVFHVAVAVNSSRQEWDYFVRFVIVL